MTFTRLLAPVVGLLFLSVPAGAQTVQVNSQNRTIEVAAESSIEITADRVAITVGYRNFGATHDDAFADNARVAARILKAWQDAGVDPKTIATAELNSHPVPEDDLRTMSAADRKAKQFEAFQSWRISESPEVAQKLLDIAVDAGANEVGTPDWSLSNSAAADNQAYAAALASAHSIADQMAGSFGGKTGPLLYASNTARRFDVQAGGGGGAGGGMFRDFDRATPKSRPETKLLPQKIQRSAYVRAIFALE